MGLLPNGTMVARGTATIIAFALVGLAFPLPVAAASLTLDPTSGPRGTLVDARGSSYPLSSVISILWDGSLIASGTADSRTFTIPFRVPRGASAGPHVVTMCVTGSGPTGCGGTSDTAIFTVVISAGTPTPVPTLPPPSTPIPGASPTPVPTLPSASFPLGGETPTPEPPPVAVVTPAPTPPNELGAVPDDFPDLWIKAIEVTQGIQDLQNRMPLVEDRRTYARVYVGAIGEPSWPNTYGALEARRDGQQIGWVWPENGPISAKLGGGSRWQANDSLNFRLPAAWLHGEITLRAFVYSYNVASVFDQEPQWQNNLAEVSVAFHPAQPLTVHLAPLHLHRSFHRDDVERTYDSDLDADLLPAGGSATLRIVHGLYRYHPLSLVNVDLLSGPITPPGHGDGHEFNMGGCQTTLVDWYEDDHIAITDWEPLMDDPESFVPEIGFSMDADNTTLAILDRRIEVTYWGIVEADGRIVVYGDVTGGGPLPLPGTPVFVGSCKPEPSTSSEANHTLAIHRVFYDWDDEEDLFVGMVHPSLPTLWGGQSTKGTDAVWVRMTDTFGGTSTWWHVGAETLAHEAGHAAGLKHVPCKDDDGDGVPDEKAGGALDPSHPDSLTFPVCTLADVDPEGWFGFDAYASLFGIDGPTAISNDPDQAAPNKASPFMSYENPGWADPYHYCRLLDFYGVPCDPTDLGIPWSEPDAPAGGPLTSPPDPTHGDLPPGATGLIGLRGSLDPAAGTGKVEIDYISDSPTPSAMRRYSGQYIIHEATHSLVVLDAAGNELASVPIQQHDTSHGDESTIDFELLVPAFPNAAAYQIVSAGRDVAQLDVSPNAPSVSWQPITTEADTVGGVKVKLAWLANDADGDALTHTLLYSPDGEHWQALAAGLTETTYEVPVDTLSGGDAPIFQVITIDGSRAASAVSEPIGSVPGLRPTVWAGSPWASQAARIPSGTPVLLTGTAFDPEDRGLPGEAITWSSSIDGELGSGSELLVSDLSAGRHTIAAAVTDSDGMTDTSSFELVIDGSLVQPPPDPELESAVEAIFEAIGAGNDPRAAVPEEAAPSAPDGTPVVLVILLAVGAAVVVGRALLWRLRRPNR